MPASRGSEPNLNQKSANPNNSSNSKKESVMQQQHVVDTAPPEKEKIEVIPLNLEKPTGLEMGDFLPMKFQMMGLGKILTSHMNWFHEIIKKIIHIAILIFKKL